MIACHKKTINQIKELIHNQIKFLCQYETLVNFYTLDYFVHEQWKQIPASWQHVLAAFTVQDLGNFLDSSKEFKYQETLPLSLLAFRATACTLSLPRYTENPLKHLDKFLCETHDLANTDVEQFIWDDPKQEFQKCSTQHKDLPQYCRKHVKPKKQHEIYRLSQLMHLTLQKININNVMDIGSGLGHLSRLLSLKYYWKVSTIEAESQHTSAAANLDKEAFAALSKKNKLLVVNNNKTDNVSMQELPQHFKGCISLNSSQEDLQNVIKQAWREKDGQVADLPPFALMGLHTCGDLSATLMRIFVETPEALVLLSVGCCYMKLSTEKASCGFPLSKHVKKLPKCCLSSESREIACHALEKYIERLKENGESLKIHCYRAMLEKILVKHSPNLRHVGLKGVKHAEKLKFHEYAAKALKNVPVKIPTDDIESFDSELYFCEWKNIVAIYSLRLLTAPVIESLILLDRMLFLYENGLNSCILPIFDPLVSPRNHLLFSMKHL